MKLSVIIITVIVSTPWCLIENILYILHNSCTYCHPRDFWPASSIPEVLTESSMWMPANYSAKNVTI